MYKRFDQKYPLGTFHVYQFCMKTNTHKQAFFVASAIVAGRLLTVMQIAKEISLAAKNAKAIAERAGEKANSFKPITDFIDEMGRETLKLVEEINEQALSVSRSAVDELRCTEASNRFAHAAELLGEHQRAPELLKQIEHIQQNAISQQKEVKRQARVLLDMLERIWSCMRASGVISTRSRVEAVSADEYQDSLNVVAETIEKASERIKDIIHDCEKTIQYSM